MLTPKNILPITAVKKDLMKLIKKMQEDHETLVITKDGKAAGVLMSAEEYEGLLETIEILGDKKLLRSLARADEEFRKGRSFTHAQVFGKE
jgi:prevent-host-death family protein